MGRGWNRWRWAYGLEKGRKESKGAAEEGGHKAGLGGWVDGHCWSKQEGRQRRGGEEVWVQGRAERPGKQGRRGRGWSSNRKAPQNLDSEAGVCVKAGAERAQPAKQRGKLGEGPGRGPAPGGGPRVGSGVPSACMTGARGEPKAGRHRKTGSEGGTPGWAQGPAWGCQASAGPGVPSTPSLPAAPARLTHQGAEGHDAEQPLQEDAEAVHEGAALAAARPGRPRRRP